MHMAQMDGLVVNRGDQKVVVSSRVPEVWDSEAHG